jgi:ABC-type methionine transport system ATPase subunit
VDGRDLSSIRLRDYRSQLGVVLQDNFLFDGTVADNISYGRPDATLEQIQQVSRIAHAHEFAEAFEQQYDTVVGERGVKLSGGQRQRVAIARAILANPRILVLDEATSSLDSESEALIQDGLRSLRRGRTTFVIAHRLSTIRSADQILVLEHGEIVERGTHASRRWPTRPRAPRGGWGCSTLDRPVAVPRRRRPRPPHRGRQPALPAPVHRDGRRRHGRRDGGRAEAAPRQLERVRPHQGPP